MYRRYSAPTTGLTLLHPTLSWEPRKCLSHKRPNPSLLYTSYNIQFDSTTYPKMFYCSGSNESLRMAGERYGVRGDVLALTEQHSNLLTTLKKPQYIWLNLEDLDDPIAPLRSFEGHSESAIPEDRTTLCGMLLAIADLRLVRGPNQCLFATLVLKYIYPARATNMITVGHCSMTKRLMHKRTCTFSTLRSLSLLGERTAHQPHDLPTATANKKTFQWNVRMRPETNSPLAASHRLIPSYTHACVRTSLLPFTCHDSVSCHDMKELLLTWQPRCQGKKRRCGVKRVTSSDGLFHAEHSAFARSPPNM
ncbi:hypothetical protein CCUS01_15457 [Colletotrichum cuscutae]|uniref:Uncharacterized protein n=1 Tax=Colletotrichum cuscutae TaxID=1209917 RepID=A0AAI9VI93_9PEZI|nr:hypothetical protein CCUS01_15457 [Colletotrichum cuscutae]